MSIIEKLDELAKNTNELFEKVNDKKKLEEIRIKLLGKKSILSKAKTEIRSISKDLKPIVGSKIHHLNETFNKKIDEKTKEIQSKSLEKSFAKLDITLPPRPQAFSKPASLHPISKIINKSISIFRQMGFSLAEGPEIESEWRCFDALNTPENHPARNEGDTFYFDDGKLLRTHTSTVQIAFMENAKNIPFRIISPGNAFRKDEIDRTHLPQFTQMEGLYVAKKVTLGMLKSTLEEFFKAMLGDKVSIRFRPHFFPFTEPSFEVDIKLNTKESKWLEIAGCGMVDPAVFNEVSKKRKDNLFDGENTSGFAFGFGVDRLAMILYEINDIRLLTENDQRFLKQFI